MSERIWMVVGVMDDIEVLMAAATDWSTAVELACAAQYELATENNEKEIKDLNRTLTREVKKKLDDGRYKFAEVEDDLGITWRFKHVLVR